MAKGKHWNLAPGNLLSKPRLVHIGPGAPPIAVSLDDVIPPIKPEPDTKYIRHIRIQSKLLTKFWGRAVYLSAIVLVPEGFDTHPEAHYPLIIFHDHFVTDFNDFRETPPDPNLKPDYSERFHLAGYNRIQQEEAYKNYQAWIAPGTPRMLIVKLQHANPYYDDSYAVNSANLGPYGDAIETELIPAIEQAISRHRPGLGAVRLRRLDRRLGVAGRADVLSRSLQRCVRRLPRPGRLSRLHDGRSVQAGQYVLHCRARTSKVEQPAMRDYLGHTLISMRDNVAYEAALGDHGRSGEQFDIWQAVYSPAAEDGYPQTDLRQADRRDRPSRRPSTGASTTILDAILQRDWATLGPKLQGKLHLLCRLGRHLFPQRRGLPDGRLPEADRHARTRRALRGRGSLRTARRALLERRSDEAQLVLAAALQPDVCAADHGAHSENRAARSGPDKLAILKPPLILALYASEPRTLVNGYWHFAQRCSSASPPPFVA